MRVVGSHSGTLHMSTGEDTAGAGALHGENVAVHSVPCRMRVQGGISKAAVNNYFESSIRNRGTGTVHAVHLQKSRIKAV